MTTKTNKGIIIGIGQSSKRNCWYYKMSENDLQYCSFEEIVFENIGKNLIVEFDGKNKPQLSFE